MMRRSAAATAYARARSPARSRRKGLTTLDDVRAHTKASASCGSCTGLVEQLLDADTGRRLSIRPPSSRCASCTDLGHDDVRRLIVAKGLKTIPAVMQELKWKTSCGCAKCRPALNYYLRLRLARRICRRQPVALHQRARARQHPEGRHLFGGAAHVGRRHQRQGAARHRRRGRQVRHPDGQGAPAASASTCSASRRRTCPRSGPISARPAWSPAMPMPRRCAR